MDKNVLWDLSYGMYVVGSKDDRKVGCIVNTAVQITSDPMTILVSVNHDNYTNKIISKKNKFSLSILGEKTDISLIGTFGYKSSKDIDKYENFETFEMDDMPVLKDSCGVIICEVIDKLETSTHTAFLGKVIDMKKINNDKPMTYKYYHEVLKGKSPEKAPTFIKEEIINEVAKINEELEVDYIGENIKIALNTKFLSDFVQNLNKNKDITLEFIASNNSVKIREEDVEDYLYILMPLALKD